MKIAHRIFQQEEPCVFSEIDEAGRLRLFLHLSRDDGVTDTVWSAFEAWQEADSNDDPCLQLQFRMSDALDFLIDIYQCIRRDGVCLEPDTRPRVEAMRAEAAELLRRIDEITYDER